MTSRDQPANIFVHGAIVLKRIVRAYGVLLLDRRMLQWKTTGKETRMNISELITCPLHSCPGTDRSGFRVPDADIDVNAIRVVIVAEAPPSSPDDYFYASGTPSYLETLLPAFRDAGVNATSMREILDLGVYVTTAIKCAKTGYAVPGQTIATCSILLEKEISLFPNIKAYILGGDVAIRMMNGIWKRRLGRKIIPAGSTYKIRAEEYYAGEARVFPSYTPAGKNFLIEKSKRQMFADDLRAALSNRHGSEEAKLGL